jgi:flagellar basal body-associated protein FliL
MKSFAKIALAVALQVAVAIALVHWVGRPWLAGEPWFWERAATTDSVELGPLVAMDEILVNVAETGGRRFFRTALALEMTDPSAEVRAVERMPVLRGKVIDLLSRKRMEELVTPSARDDLRVELMHALNAEVGSGNLRDVHFTEFLVQ